MHRLKNDFEQRMLKKIYESRKNVRIEKLRYDEIRNVYSLNRIIAVMKSRIMKWVEYHK